MCGLPVDTWKTSPNHSMFISSFTVSHAFQATKMQCWYQSRQTSKNISATFISRVYYLSIYIAKFLHQERMVNSCSPWIRPFLTKKIFPITWTSVEYITGRHWRASNSWTSKCFIRILCHMKKCIGNETVKKLIVQAWYCMNIVLSKKEDIILLAQLSMSIPLPPLNTLFWGETSLFCLPSPPHSAGQTNDSD